MHYILVYERINEYCYYPVCFYSAFTNKLRKYR